jgi:ABC-2 type transport system permease protein
MEFKFSRAWNVSLRYFYSNSKTLISIFDFLYWPIIDILLFGFIGVWLSKDQSVNIVASLVTALVLWQIYYRTNMEVARNFAQELWDDNLINMFASPLTLTELIIGLMLTGFVSLAITIPYGAFLVKIVFNYSIFKLGSLFFLLAFMVAISGWSLGLISAGLLLYKGQRIDTMVWAIAWIPAPFCSVYYPIEILPYWMQIVGKCFPMTYAFNAMRTMLSTQTISYSDIFMCAILSILLFAASLLFFFFMFKKSKANGLRT